MPVPKGFRETKLEFPASRCARESFRIKVLSKDRRLVVCCPKRQWNSRTQRCKNGTRATKMQVRVSGAALKGRKGRKAR